MKKKVVSVVLSLALLTGGCGSAALDNSDSAGTEESTAQIIEGESKDGGFSDKYANGFDEDVSKDKDESENQAESALDTNRISLMGSGNDIYYDPDLVPSIPEYKVADDFSNVVYANKFEGLFNPDYEFAYDAETVKKRVEQLTKYGFSVNGDYGYDEFFDLYESNRYSMFPNFVTVDSLMHTYHLYFAYLMRQTEKNYLADELKTLSASMLNKAVEQYELAKGSDWESAALNNIEFFYIGSMLQDDTVEMPDAGKGKQDDAKSEYDRIMAAGGIDTCSLTGLYEDYTQYKPRGYYEGDENLEKYFRAMMWYGRIPFALDNDELLKSAALISLAIGEDSSSWDAMYSISSFFAGAADDIIYTQILDALNTSYGKNPDVSTLISDNSSFDKYKDIVSEFDPPQINSVPVDEGDDPVIASFRFMGQRFTIDAAIMQRLIYSAVEENSKGDRRYLPDVLDTEAALGSEMAMEILRENGATDYENYSENMEQVKELFADEDAAVWSASLYSGWLNTLRPLLTKKGKGYPMFMQNDEWVKKDMETFAGSYAELKHDTILYAKQNMAEMGGGDEEEIPDDRGYVEPEPVVYSRFISLSEKTKTGLKGYNMLSSQAEDGLDRLTVIAKTLLTISEKELRNESLSEDEYNFIREYGGYLEHLWQEAVKDTLEENLIYSDQAPCPIIADIATDPNGEVLEVGTGEAQTMYVVFPIDGELHVGSGSVYSFYQFTVPITERLTDKQWRDMINGGYLNDDYQWVEAEDTPNQPEWTQSYRTGTR